MGVEGGGLKTQKGEWGKKMGSKKGEEKYNAFSHLFVCLSS